MRISSRLFTQYHVMDFFLHIKKYKCKKNTSKNETKSTAISNNIKPSIVKLNHYYIHHF